MSDSRNVPPSFTPSGRPARPPSADDAISVSGDRPRSGRIARPDDAAPAAGQPRVRRQSSREIPVTPSAGRSGAPRSVPPRRTGGAAGAAGAQAGRDGGTRLMPERPAQAPRRVAGSATPAGPARPAPGGPGAPRGSRPVPATAGPERRLRVRKGRVAGLAVVVVLLLLLAWPVGLLVWANGKIQHVDALSTATATPGTTYLLAGSDARGSGGVDDATSGARTDTILLLHQPTSGPASLISIPRDTYAEIPGHDANKINAAYSLGGPSLLVQAVEELSGMKVDHYVEIGFGGVEDVVDAVGGVRLCLDYDVDDSRSDLVWQSGCHEADGATALAFSRMRYSDPKGDIGRAERQRQVISAITSKVQDPSLLVQPSRQVSLLGAGLGALVVDEDSNVVDLGRLALAFRAANGPGGVTGTPPIEDLGYRPGGVGATVLLDPDTVDQFWADVRDGNLEPGAVGGLPGS
ncbi:LCP family protein [Puerhibacterium sp. TATVAM-FAB25]|uniref:LCP family protein n=1 Tax=Puerhibacterium sp. TATVAM-FAB25 TaxID=3093699 RepID=UPI00397B93BB